MFIGQNSVNTMRPHEIFLTLIIISLFNAPILILGNN